MLPKAAASTYAISTEHAGEWIVFAHEKVKKRLRYPQKIFKPSADAGR